MKSIFIHHHLGLGDHIICNGLVRELIKRDSPTFAYVPVRKQYYKTVSQMYSDDSRIVCLPVVSESAGSEIPHLPQKDYCEKYYRVGFERVRGDWDRSFYDSVGVPFEKRWESFKMQRNHQRETELENRVNPSKEPFILLHEQGSVYICPIDHGRSNIKTISVDDYKTDCLLDWCGLIEKAQEIHCMDSCFIHLCSSMGISGVFHDYGVNKHLGHRFVLHPLWKRILVDGGLAKCKTKSSQPTTIGL